MMRRVGRLNLIHLNISSCKLNLSQSASAKIVTILLLTRAAILTYKNNY